MLCSPYACVPAKLRDLIAVSIRSVSTQFYSLCTLPTVTPNERLAALITRVSKRTNAVSATRAHFTRRLERRVLSNRLPQITSKGVRSRGAHTHAQLQHKCCLRPSPHRNEPHGGDRLHRRCPAAQRSASLTTTTPRWTHCLLLALLVVQLAFQVRSTTRQTTTTGGSALRAPASFALRAPLPIRGRSSPCAI